MAKSLFRTLIKNLLRGIVEDFLFVESRNIERERQRRALQETALFVEQYMDRARPYNNRYDVLAFAASFAPRSENGLICEFGVAGGKSIRHLSSLFPDRTVYGFDSFEGLPGDWAHLPKGAYRQPVPRVPKNVELVKGWFSDTLPEFVERHPGPVDFLHIDCDLYHSAKTVFDYLGDRIQAGTVICFDEFMNYTGWKEGEFKAFHEFIQQCSFGVEYLAYNQRGTQVALRLTSLSQEER